MTVNAVLKYMLLTFCVALLFQSLLTLLICISKFRACGLLTLQCFDVLLCNLELLYCCLEVYLSCKLFFVKVAFVFSCHKCSDV